MTEYARDLSPNFRRCGDVTNVEAINQQIENLLFTHPIERPFTPVGSTIPKLIFRIMDRESVARVRAEIIQLITAYTNKIKIDTLKVDVRAIASEHALYIKVEYTTTEFQQGEYFVKQDIK